MKCTKCGKTFASHTNGPEICWDCYMKDINSYQVTNNPSNCDMPLPQGFGEQKGWICPVCGRGLAPWTSFCPCQSDFEITYGTSTGTNVDPFIYKEYQDILDRANKALDVGEIKNVDLLEG